MATFDLDDYLKRHQYPADARAEIYGPKTLDPNFKVLKRRFSHLKRRGLIHDLRYRQVEHLVKNVELRKEEPVFVYTIYTKEHLIATLYIGQNTQSLLGALDYYRWD